jgi:ferredoxin--NADP+ reductase
MRLEDYDSGEHYRARILSNTAITGPGATEEVREITLEVDRDDFSYDIGQSVGVIVEGPFRHAVRSDLDLGHTHHFRLYTVADTPVTNERGKPVLKLCVKRCSYIDEHSGEEYPGIASNYLCDRSPDDLVTINGPFGLPFEVPADHGADLLLISMGTGIAPFRAFVKHLYRDVGDWRGRIRLFYGARSGMELLYMNDEIDDFTQYYDEETFEAFRALSPRPQWDEPADLEGQIQSRGEEVLDILRSDSGYVYVAGRSDILQTLEKTLTSLLGSEQEWRDLKLQKSRSGHWRELIY